MTLIATTWAKSPVIALAAIDRAHAAAADPLGDPVGADPLGRDFLVDRVGRRAGAHRRAPIGLAHRSDPAQQLGPVAGLAREPGVALRLGDVEQPLEQRDRLALEREVSHRRSGW